MSTRHLRLVVDNQSPQNLCSCRTWGLLRPISRELVLHDLMHRARHLHGVGLALEACDGHVVISDLVATTGGRSGVRRVMSELCSWSDCARVTLELTPSAHWGLGGSRLATFCAWLGFEPRREQPTLLDPQESLIRHPVRGRAHVRL